MFNNLNDNDNNNGKDKDEKPLDLTQALNDLEFEIKMEQLMGYDLDDSDSEEEFDVQEHIEMQQRKAQRTLQRQKLMDEEALKAQGGPQYYVEEDENFEDIGDFDEIPDPYAEPTRREKIDFAQEVRRQKQRQNRRNTQLTQRTEKPKMTGPDLDETDFGPGFG